MPYLKRFMVCILLAAATVAPAYAQDFTERFESLQAAAAQGDLDATYELGVLYHLGSRASRGGPEHDPERGVAIFAPLAAGGDARAQWRLGGAYELGRGVERDADTAYRWYRAAADQGFIPAMQPLGRLYLTGTGTAQDADTAYALFREAAEAGNLRAKIALARLYQDADLAPDYDPVRAVHWFRRAAQRDDNNGVRGLSNAYLHGNGVERDPTQALRIYVEYAQRTGRAQTSAMARVVSQMTEAERAAADATSRAENWELPD